MPVSLTAPKNTLGYHLARPLRTARNMAGVPCAQIAQSFRKYKEKDSLGDSYRPEQAAIQFYLMNHGMAEMAKAYHVDEPMAPKDLDFVKAYFAKASDEAARAFFYTLIICIRESRHVKNLGVIKPTLVSKFGQAAADYIATVPDSANEAQQLFISKQPLSSITMLAQALAWQFYNGSYNGGYGGAKWGAIADTMASYVTGKTTAEMMLDTVWCLSHNNGPIFNKGFLYGHYHSEHILRVLDVQRAGQMPQAVNHDATVRNYANPESKLWAEWLADRFPGSAAGPVDWNKVKSLGAIGNYSSEIKEIKPKGFKKWYNIGIGDQIPIVQIERNMKEAA